MATTVDALRLRLVMGREHWNVPQQYGGDGWQMWHKNDKGSVIVSTADWDDHGEWTHASIAWADRLPTYEDLALLHEAVWPDGFAYQVFAPPNRHVNFHQYALHLWGRTDGVNVLPDFGSGGMI